MKRCEWCGCSDRYCRCPSKVVDEVEKLRAKVQRQGNEYAETIRETRRKLKLARATVERVTALRDHARRKGSKQTTWETIDVHLTGILQGADLP